MGKWYMEGNILKFDHRGCISSFVMPDYFRLKDTHPDLLKLAEYALYWKFDADIIKDYEWTRKPKGNGIGLNYSGGMDSTAVLTLIDNYENVHLFYCNRWNIKIEGSLLNETNAFRAFRMVKEISGREVNVIKTDLHKIRNVEKNLQYGYPSDDAMFIGSILLADVLNIRYISAGAMLNTCFKKDGVYRPFHTSKYWVEHSDLYRKAGLELFYPVMCCSEVLTNKICNMGRYAGVGQTCVRGKVEGEGCLNCFKCFRKKLINGVQIPMNKETARTLEFEKMKKIEMIFELGYAINKYGFKIPELDKFKFNEFDLNFFEDYCEQELGCVPLELKDFTITELNRYTKPMAVDLKTFTENYFDKITRHLIPYFMKHEV